MKLSFDAQTYVLQVKSFPLGQCYMFLYGGYATPAFYRHSTGCCAPTLFHTRLLHAMDSLKVASWERSLGLPQRELR